MVVHARLIAPVDCVPRNVDLRAGIPRERQRRGLHDTRPEQQEDSEAGDARSSGPRREHDPGMSHAELIRNVCAIQLTLTVLRNRGFIEPGRRNRRPLSLRVGIHYRFATTGYTFWIIPFYP